MMLSRAAVAGLAATVPMTIVMEVLRAVLPREQSRRMPPREVVDRTIAQAGVSHQIDSTERTAVTAIAHLAFGTLAGAVYGALTQSRRAGSQRIWTGAAYGLAVWALAYGAGLPALGLHPPASTDTPERNETLIVSHLVWGAALGMLTRD
jgi:uncharacterized membrane protein YagU involved in acid resistance